MIQDLMSLLGLVFVLLWAWRVAEKMVAVARQKAVVRTAPAAKPEPKHGPTAPESNCACDLCQEARRIGSVLMGPMQMGKVQIGVVQVRRGNAPVAVLEDEFATQDGLGKTVVIITSDGIYQRLLRPTLMQHFSTREAPGA
jgi:hypothetical protein